MKRYGSELEKIVWITSKGVPAKKGADLKEDYLYEINRLSISEDTYIASGFHSFVVKLKNPPK